MTPATATDATLLGAALSIAESLVSAAEPAEQGCTWQAEIIAGVDGDEAVIDHGDVGATLYDGTAGIALALAACATAAPPTEASRFSNAARNAVRHSLAAAPDLLDAGNLSLFEGATGIALGAVTVGGLCDDEALEASGLALARSVAGRLGAVGGDLDLISGTAGTLLGLQGILGDTGEMAELEAAASRLAAAATPQTWGSAWPAAGGDVPLLGFGHGSAGIVLALAEVASANGDPRLFRACAEGLEYERGWYDPDRVAWPDLRKHEPGTDPSGWMSAWCHGAVGIGLSRLRLTRLVDGPANLAEASAALQASRNLVVSAGTALQAGRASDCSACHGLAGVVELLLVAAEALGVDDHARAARRVAALMVEQRDAAGGTWPCGLPGAGEIPALMTGTAGIALTLLRVAGETTVPTPLLPGPAHW